MQDLLTRLVHMNWNEAHNHLMSLNLPADLRVSLADQAQKMREINALHSKRTKLTQFQHDELWHRLLAPLKYDLNNAKVGLKLKPFDAAPERHTAFSEYVTLLEKLLAGLQKMQMDEASKIGGNERPRTPAELATERGLPMKGAHWTHWINERTRHRIEALFDAIPTQSKRPKPFAYRIPPDLFKRDREALQKRTLNELDLVRQEIALLRAMGEVLTPDQTFRLRELEDEVTDMGHAMVYLSCVMHNEPVPHTWRGLNRRHYVQGDDVVLWTPEMEQALRIYLQEPASTLRGKKSKRPRRYKK